MATTPRYMAAVAAGTLPRYIPGATPWDMELDEPWLHDAACPTHDPEAFFPERGEPAAYAKKVCAGCPVKQECLDYAQAHSIFDGVWGGLTPNDRKALRRSTKRRDLNKP